MNWVQTLAVVFHVLLALGIVGLVLLQRGRGADAGAGFGAGAREPCSARAGRRRSCRA